MKAYIFSGQGSQVVGMGKELCTQSSVSKEYLEIADDILGFSISQLMYDGSEEELKKTRITQPIVFLYTVIKSRVTRDFKPDMVAGHSLGEISALVATRAISFADGLRLVYKRATAMQTACELQPSIMAAVMGIDDKVVEAVCNSIKNEIVVPANYNCPGQLVISGSIEGIRIAGEKLKEAGARRVLPINVGGAFHSPLMEPAKIELEKAILETPFKKPLCPIYQNINAIAEINPDIIKQNLINQLTSPVRWTQTIENMIADGALHFIEVSPKPILISMVKKINDKTTASAL